MEMLIVTLLAFALLYYKATFGSNVQKKELEKFEKLIAKFEAYLLSDTEVRTHWPLNSIVELNGVDYSKISKHVESTRYRTVLKLAKEKSKCSRLSKTDPIRLEYIKHCVISLERIEDKISL